MNFDGFLVGFDGLGMHFDVFLLDLQEEIQELWMHFSSFSATSIS